MFPKPLSSPFVINENSSVAQILDILKCDVKKSSASTWSYQMEKQSDLERWASNINEILACMCTKIMECDRTQKAIIERTKQLDDREVQLNCREIWMQGIKNNTAMEVEGPSQEKSIDRNKNKKTLN